MTASYDPERDLTISRVIRAPRAAVWRAWTDPRQLEQWWVPAPARSRVAELDLQPGGAFESLISEDGGDFVPHVRFCFLAVDDQRRLVFTDALTPGWRPAEQSFLTAVITLEDHPEGTRYAAHAMHKTPGDRKTHEDLGFYDGWGTVAEQLAKLVEQGEQEAW